MVNMGIWDSVMAHQRSLGKPYASQWGTFVDLQDRLEELTRRGIRYELIPEHPLDGHGEIRIYLLDTQQKACHDGKHGPE